MLSGTSNPKEMQRFSSKVLKQQHELLYNNLIMLSKIQLKKTLASKKKEIVNFFIL